MAETWEQTKARLRKIGIDFQKDIIVVSKPKREEIPAKLSIPLYEIRKVTLPPNKKHEHGKVVVYGVAASEADWWIEYKLKPKIYQDDDTETKTLVFYEKFLIGGTPKERSIYSNPARFCIDDFPALGNPRRIN
jgi:hypothetical protein